LAKTKDVQEAKTNDDLAKKKAETNDCLPPCQALGGRQSFVFAFFFFLKGLNPKPF